MAKLHHLLVLLVVCFGCTSWASEIPPNTLVVVGNGVVTAPSSTVGRVTVGFELRDEDASACLLRAQTFMSQIINSLQANETLGVSQLKTDGFAFAPLAYWEQPPVSGYGVKNFVSFNTPVETIGDAIAVAIASGAQIIQNVQFITSPNSGNVRQYYLQAQSLALDDAITQGKAIMEKLKCNWDGIYSIVANSPGYGYGHADYGLAGEASRSMMQASAPVIMNDAEEIRASVTVQLTYSACMHW